MTLVRAARPHFDRYLERRQLASYYLHTWLSTCSLPATVPRQTRFFESRAATVSQPPASTVGCCRRCSSIVGRWRRSQETPR